MGNWMPSMSLEQMRAVMARQPSAAPGVQPQVQPGTPQPGPGAMTAPATSVPPAVAPSRVPAALPVNEQQAQLHFSDDAGISPEMRKAMQPTQDAMGGLNAEQGRYQDLSSKVQNLKPPSYEDYKPPLWKKLLAPVVGAVAGRNAEPVVSSMLDAPYERAQKGYEQQKSQLQQQIEAERGIAIPLAESRARVAQEGFKNFMDVQKNALDTKKEAETEKHNAANEELRGQFNDIQENFKQGIIGEKNQRDLDRIASQNDNLDLKRQALALQQQIAAFKENNPRGNVNGGVLTGAEAAEWKRKTSADQGRLRGLIAERSKYAAGGLDTADADKKIDEIQGRLDKAEDDILAKRKGGVSADATPANAAANVFNVTKWQAANPKGDANAARAEAKRQGMQIKE